MRWEEADSCFLLKVCFTQRSWGEKPRGILPAEAVAPQQSLQQWGVSTENGWLMTLLLPLDRDFKKKIPVQRTVFVLVGESVRSSAGHLERFYGNDMQMKAVFLLMGVFDAIVLLPFKN